VVQVIKSITPECTEDRGNGMRMIGDNVREQGVEQKCLSDADRRSTETKQRSHCPADGCKWRANNAQTRDVTNRRTDRRTVQCQLTLVPCSVRHSVTCTNDTDGSLLNDRQQEFVSIIVGRPKLGIQLYTAFFVQSWQHLKFSQISPFHYSDL